jgi:hypothetical protein
MFADPLFFHHLSVASLGKGGEVAESQQRWSRWPHRGPGRRISVSLASTWCVTVTISWPRVLHGSKIESLRRARPARLAQLPIDWRPHG